MLLLPPEILGAIAEKSGRACQQLWKYLPESAKHELKKMPITPDFIRDFMVSGTIIRGNKHYEKTSLFGRPHSFDDLPAISGHSIREWYVCGQLHRYNAPAIECEDTAIDVRSKQYYTSFTPRILHGYTSCVWFIRGKPQGIMWFNGSTMATHDVSGGLYSRDFMDSRWRISVSS